MNTPTPQIIPTLDQIERMTPEAAHTAYCEGGWITVQAADGVTASAPCRACRAERNREALERSLSEAGIGARYLRATWDDLEQRGPIAELAAVGARIRDVIASGHNAILAGPPGTGKTQAATLLLADAIRAGASARIVNLGHVGMLVRASYDRSGAGMSEADAVKALAGVDLLAIDDLGAGETGEMKVELRVLYFAAEARHNARRPTIITTNLPPPGAMRLVGARIANRLMPLEAFNFAHGKNFRTPDPASGTAWRPG